MTISYKTNSIKFNKIKELKKLSYFLFIFLLFFILVFLIMNVSNIGYDPLMNIVNKDTIFSIIISGFSLGVSTFIVQSISRNKMADTSILGVSGINLLVVSFLLLPLNLSDEKNINIFNKMLPIVFILCSSLAMFVIFLLSKKSQYKISKKFILAGILMNFVFSAFSNSISVFLTSGKESILTKYTNGNIQAPSDMFCVYFAIVTILIACIWFMIIMNKFKITCINPYIASQLGINIKSIYFQSLLLSGIFTGVSFTLTGNVVFLGLLAANISYTIFKSNYKYSFFSSGLIAIIIMGITYFFNRNILTNSPLNTSFLIPLVSCPYFIYLILKK